MDTGRVTCPPDRVTTRANTFQRGSGCRRRTGDHKAPPIHIPAALAPTILRIPVAPCIVGAGEDVDVATLSGGQVTCPCPPPLFSLFACIGLQPCHPERSEGSRGPSSQALRCAQ